MTAATAMQEALWWVHQRAKNKSVYNLTWRLGCDKAPDLEALGLAWQAVVDRHEALRTSVVQREGVIELVVRPELAVQVQLVEVDEATPELLRLIAEEIQEQAMHLDQAPLAQLTVVRVGEVHELLLTVHHVVLDGWANQLLVSELSSAYEAACQGRKPEFATEAVPFSAYAQECAQARDAGKWQASLDHWRKTLDGAVSTTVAADRHNLAGTGAPGTTLRYALSDEAVAGVGELTKATFATPFVVALAALQIVLARGGAGEDVALGVVVANRMSQRDQELMGYTANLCIARATVTGADTVLDVVGRARDAMWTMLAHQTVPYPAVFGALTESAQAMLRDSAPLLLNYLGPIGNGLSLGDVPMQLHRSPNRAARADIAVAMWETPDGFMTEIEYNTGRYDRETVLRLMEDIDTVLSAPGATAVSELDLGTRSVAGYVDHQAKPVTTGAALPESAAAEQVSRVWEQVLGEPPAEPDEDFFAQGGRSLKVLQLASAVREETGTELDLVRWLAEPTPRRLVEQVASTAGGQDASTLVVLRESVDGGPHLHLLPGAGGGPHDYRALLAALPAHWRVTASQERRPFGSVAEMAAAYRADLDAAGARPDLLGGWSMGGQIAFELARGYPVPVPLVLIDSAPPVGYDFGADTDSLRFEAFATGAFGGGLPRVRGGDSLRVAALAAWLAADGREVSATVLAQQWATYRRHAQAVSDYVPSGGAPGPALVVAADLVDAQVDQWAERVGSVRRLRVATDHAGVLRGDPVRAVAEAMTHLL
ncbi:hypothetical protein GCM10010174_18440 [Kutzneria viridogrisea]|uniref:Thioesterase domain-containing protein n=1 Tax=Kutzneria viridogrisea TaxID=47990 RepID=A0ABR6B7N3_9PSEU|nr:thioesterase domain-containing protein [Kutzneria viridogrisea]